MSAAVADGLYRSEPKGGWSVEKRRLTMVGAAIGLVVLMASPGATGQVEAPDEMVEMSATARRVEWTPRIDYERMVLTISGQDILIERLFGAGEKPNLDLVEEKDARIGHLETRNADLAARLERLEAALGQIVTTSETESDR